MKTAYFNLPRFREELDMTQQDLAVAIGVSLSTVARWEAAGEVPRWIELWTRGYRYEHAMGDASLTTLDKINVPTSKFPPCPECSSGNVMHASEDSNGHPIHGVYRCRSCWHLWEPGKRSAPAALPAFNLKPYGG